MNFLRVCDRSSFFVFLRLCPSAIFVPRPSSVLGHSLYVPFSWSFLSSARSTSQMLPFFWCHHFWGSIIIKPHSRLKLSPFVFWGLSRAFLLTVLVFCWMLPLPLQFASEFLLNIVCLQWLYFPTSEILWLALTPCSVLWLSSVCDRSTTTRTSFVNNSGCRCWTEEVIMDILSCSSANNARFGVTTIYSDFKGLNYVKISNESSVSVAELDMGPNFLTQPDPTHSASDRTQPIKNCIHRPDPTQPILAQIRN